MSGAPSPTLPPPTPPPTHEESSLQLRGGVGGWRSAVRCVTAVRSTYRTSCALSSTAPLNNSTSHIRPATLIVIVGKAGQSLWLNTRSPGYVMRVTPNILSLVIDHT